jgi:16S rRNA (guanine(966)-N(2))-methyltransferase RsmD
MRVITGSARGTVLISPEGTDVRPTSGKVKEAMFSAIQFDVEGRRVLDLFAGSGQLGIEALSRGAASADFVDNSRVSAEIIRKNLEKCRLADRARVVVGDYKAFLKSAAKGAYGLILMDPPYASAQIQTEYALKITESFDILAPGGIMICESDRTEAPCPGVGRLELVRVYTFGRTRVARYERRGDA